MINKEYNEKAINDVYRNAKIALQSINDLLPAVLDEDLKTELKVEYDGYNDVLSRVEKYMRSVKLEPKDIGVFKKAMMNMAIKMKTLCDKSRNQIAGMMVEGTGMGINELTAMKNQSNKLGEKVLAYLNELLELELEYEKKLRTYL